MTHKATPIRILVTEDQAIVRAGLVAIFKHIPDIEVVGEAGDGLEALTLYKELKPEVVLLDLVMPTLDGLATIPRLLKLDPDARILIVTGFGDSDNVYQAIIQGASGVILKDSSYEQFLEAIYTVSRGGEFIPASIAMRMMRERSYSGNDQEQALPENEDLTKREIDTLQCIAEGLTNQEIAERLVLQERTVAKYVSNILKKIQVENRTQAALYALRHGISELD